MHARTHARMRTHSPTQVNAHHFYSSVFLFLCFSGGSDSFLEKIQKAAEVVASAVLPPTEQQGVRLQENHYRAVAAPSAPIEVALPACAYNLPSDRAEGE